MDSNFHYENIISNITKYISAFKSNSSECESHDYNILFLLAESDSKTIIKVADYLLVDHALIHQIRVTTAAIIGRLAISISATSEAKKKYYRYFIDPFSDPNAPVETEISAVN